MMLRRKCRFEVSGARLGVEWITNELTAGPDCRGSEKSGDHGEQCGDLLPADLRDISCLVVKGRVPQIQNLAHLLPPL